MKPSRSAIARCESPDFVAARLVERGGPRYNSRAEKDMAGSVSPANSSMQEFC
jgi:hypothetical protein